MRLVSSRSTTSTLTSLSLALSRLRQRLPARKLVRPSIPVVLDANHEAGLSRRLVEVSRRRLVPVLCRRLVHKLVDRPRSRVEGTRPTKADGRARIGVPSHPGRCESGVALPNETGDELTLLKPSYVTIIFCPPAEVPITSGPLFEKRADLPPGFFAGLLLPAEKKPKPPPPSFSGDLPFFLPPLFAGLRPSPAEKKPFAFAFASALPLELPGFSFAVMSPCPSQATCPSRAFLHCSYWLVKRQICPHRRPCWVMACEHHETCSRRLRAAAHGAAALSPFAFCCHRRVSCCRVQAW